jgi:preprotein translocase subunit SecA
MYDLSPQQIQVLQALLSGVTMTAAADAAGVHRNTVSHWRASHLGFRYAINDALYERSLHHRERALELIDLAYEQLHHLLAAPDTPAGIRMKAIQYIIEKATTAPEPKPEVELNFETVQCTPESHPRNLHNSAQPPAPKPEPAPVQTIRREGPKVGRNDPCPCGSHKKFKQSCINLHNAPSGTVPLASQSAA